MSVCTSVGIEQLGSQWSNFHEIWYPTIFPKLSRKFKFQQNLTQTTGTLHTVLWTFTISRWTLLRMRNASDKSCRQNQSTHFVFCNFFPENRAVYETVWKNAVQQYRPQTIRRMRTACWITKATNTHSEYVTLIAISLQQWLHERTSMLGTRALPAL